MYALTGMDNLSAEAETGPALRVTVSNSESDNIHSQAGLLNTWNQSYSQLSGGYFKGGLSTFDVPDMRLFIEQMNQAVYQTGKIPEMCLGFGIPVRASGKCTMCGELAQASDLVVFSGKSGFEFVSSRDFLFLGVEVQLPERRSEFSSLVQELETRLHARRRVIRLDAYQAAQLSALFKSMFHSADPGSDQGLGQPRLRLMQRQFIGSVIDSVDGTGPFDAQGRAGQNQWSIIKCIRESVIEGPECPLTVAELALRLKLSRRTIQNAVASTLDMSPLAYLRALRLSEVRREIGSAASVTEIATRWGFWHFGYFARDYRAMFGELPSDTLARCRGPARPRKAGQRRADRSGKHH